MVVLFSTVTLTVFVCSTPEGIIDEGTAGMTGPRCRLILVAEAQARVVVDNHLSRQRVSADPCRADAQATLRRRSILSYGPYH